MFEHLDGGADDDRRARGPFYASPDTRFSCVDEIRDKD
jgi:hypothetical protein